MTRKIIWLLTFVVIVLMPQVAQAQLASASRAECAVLEAGGYYVDRYASGRGDIYSKEGALVAISVRDAAILRSCFPGAGQGSAVIVPAVRCTGCAPITTYEATR
jgi:hypothetical protein